MHKYIVQLIILFVISSCDQNKNKLVDVSSIEVEVEIDRFDQKFYEANSSNLNELKSEYTFLFPVQNHDSVWLNKIRNEQEIYQKVTKIFKDFSVEKNQLKQLFKHVKYYHPSFKPPKAITLITNLDYQNKVILADSLLFISLDLYLGEQDEIYNDFPKYLSKNYRKSHLIVDVAEEISNQIVIKERNRQFLSSMINEGKKMFLIDSYLPKKEDFEKIGYTNEELEWVKLNEAMIWKYFIENKLLFSTDAGLYNRFIANAPFSKFYIDIDKQSPGKIGVYFGWKIVKAYMSNNNVTLQQLLQTNAEEIFKKSKFKPKK